jgi:hypothetical protein
VSVDAIEHERGVGAVQSMFRDVNERVNAMRRSRAVWVPSAEWVCECAEETCSERLLMTPEEYEELRSNPTRFAVAPDDVHVFPEAERIVEKRERYWVVEKVGEAAKVAKDQDVR